MAVEGFSKPGQLTDSAMLADFHCGSETIDDWVSKYAAKAKSRGTAVLYVARPVEDGEILEHAAGFYTLSAYSLQRNAVAASWVTRNTPSSIPAILLGMLAVDERYRGTGLGSALLQDAVLRSRFVADTIGAKVLVVDPLTPALEDFYGKFGFRVITGAGMMAAKL